MFKISISNNVNLQLKIKWSGILLNILDHKVDMSEFSLLKVLKIFNTQ